MLIEFRTENYRSLRDEQVLTLEASLSADSDPRPRKVPGHDESLLPAAVLYGANASGKSNVLSAFAFMRDAVVLSYRIWEADGGVPRTQFAWGEKRGEPSTFVATFLIDGTKYEYGFVVNDVSVEEEWLYAWPNGRKQAWFERDNDHFKFSQHLEGPNDVVKQVTRPNALFLSVASQYKHAQLLLVYSWFRTIVSINVQGTREYLGASYAATRLFVGNTSRMLFPTDDNDEFVTTQVRTLLKAADTGIVDVKIIEDDDDEQRKSQFSRRRRILLKHQSDNDDSWLDFDEESRGTKTLFRIAAPLVNTLSSGGILLIDELESSLHPLLGATIVQMFNCPKTNAANAQIIFTTHDTNLLGTTLDEPPLRRDQIWFTEKGKDGASRLYPLTDFKPRKSENLERGYLQGRYGAVPFLGGIDQITE
jgi:AAA15 family ATPase/GTPase